MGLREQDLLREVTQLRSKLDAARRNAVNGENVVDVANAAALGILSNLPTLTPLHVLRAHTRRIRACSWAPADDVLLSIGADNYICLWDVRSGLIRNIIDITMNQATAADATEDLQLVFAGGLYANVEAFSHNSRPPEDGYSEYSSSALYEHGGRINCVIYLQGHKLLTAASVDGAVLWDINNVKVIQKFPHKTDVSATLQTAPDGQTFITGAADGVPRLWDVRKSDPLVCTMYGHESEITCIERLNCDRTFVTGSDDAVVNLYDLRLDFPLASYNRADSHLDQLIEDQDMPSEGNDQDQADDSSITSITGLGASPSGRILLSGCRNGCVYVWDIFDTMAPVDFYREQGPIMALKMAHSRKAMAVVSWGNRTNLKIMWPN